MIIMVDIDGVLYPLVEEGIAIYNKKYNKTLKYEDIKEYKVSDELLQCFGEVKYSTNGYPLNIEYVKRMAEVHDVYLLTASMKENLKEKVEWVDRVLPEIGYKKLIVAQDKHLIESDVIIDDYYKNLLNHSSKYRFLMNAPYNKDIFEGDKFIRVNNLKEVYDFLGML